MKNELTEKIPQRQIKDKAIFNAAKKTFLTQGFKSTSMDEIANLANVSKKTIYQHYKNKENLFQRVLNEHWHRVFIIHENLFDHKKSIQNNLIHFSKLFLKFIYQQDTIDLFRILIAEANLFPDLVDSLLINEKAPFTKALIDYLQEKKKTKELTIINAERSAAYFIGLLKEYHFWPMMLGFTKKRQLTNVSILINEVVNIFLKAYHC